MKKRFVLVSAVLTCIFGIFLVFRFYRFIFAKEITGEIIGIERVTQPAAVIGGNQPIPPEQVFSFAVAIQDKKTGEILTASSEDRQWAVAQKGQCAEAKFFPYPPWELEKSGTYHGARLLKLFPCK